MVIPPNEAHVAGAQEVGVARYVLYLRAFHKHQASRHSTASVKLQIGAPVRYLASLNPAKLCNWARLIVNGLYNLFIEDKTIAGHATRENAFFPIKSIMTWDYLF
jgi:hypothetical protein